MINVGFIGAGDIASTHAAALAQVNDARLVVIFDRDGDRETALAQQYGAHVVKSLDALCSFSGLDVVYILTPPSAHAEQIMAAIQVGLPVMCEKPLTLKLDDADRVIAAAKAAGVPLMTGLTHRYHPLAVRARDMLHAGELGDLVALWSHRLVTLVVPSASWLGQRDLSGGMALQYAMHDLDWECWLGGEVSHVAANEVHTQSEIDIEDNLWALLRFRNGASGSVGVSWTTPQAHTERGVIGTLGNLRIIDQQRMVGQRKNGKTIAMDLGDDYDWFDVFVRESTDIIDKIKYGQDFSISGEDGRNALEISLAVQRAAISGQMIALPLAPKLVEESP